jgi:hypothetical protein
MIYANTHTHTTKIHTHTVHTHKHIVKRIFLPVVNENYQQQQQQQEGGGRGRLAAVSSGPVQLPVENGSHDHRTELEEEEVTAEEYVTIESYQADGPGQVSFKEGENVHVLEKLEDGKVSIIANYSYIEVCDLNLRLQAYI